MNLHPDSALNMLESISTDSLKTKADRAYHALLLTQARDKNYIVQTDDSLIQVAVRYYDTHENAHCKHGHITVGEVFIETGTTIPKP